MDNKVELYEILNSRENRSFKQREIISKYNSSLISFTLNIPGPIKDSCKYRDIFNLGMSSILNTLKICEKQINYIEKRYLKTGPEGYISISINPEILKRKMIEIEDNNFLGRLFDIDVFDSNKMQISRKDLGMGLRKCLLCEEEAIICSRKKNHSTEELLIKINYLYDLYFN